MLLRLPPQGNDNSALDPFFDLEDATSGDSTQKGAPQAIVQPSSGTLVYPSALRQESSGSAASDNASASIPNPTTQCPNLSRHRGFNCSSYP